MSGPTRSVDQISQLTKIQQSTTAGTPASFLSLPGEVRNGIYELVLLDQNPIDPWFGYDRQQKYTLGLFRASKVVHDEASSLFYSQNRFDFTSASSEKVVSFLGQIGSNNAGHIRHVLIDFPGFLSLDPGDVTLEEDSISILANIQRSCANLNSLTTPPESTHAMEFRLGLLGNHGVTTEALKVVDTRFRAISSLEDIIIEVYDDTSNDYTRGIMTSHSWTIRMIEFVEEEDFSDYGNSREDDYTDFDDDDDYDIDDDSDFWRRAAD